MKIRATLKQIAKELGVSVSTVSKALNDSPEISEPTKIKIQEYAKLKNYKPNLTALNLKNRSTKTIGVIIPNILNSFFAKVFSGIEKVAEAKGYNVITCISNESLEKEIHALEMLSNGTIDGFILSIAEEAQKLGEFSHFLEIIKEGIPIVMFDRIADEVHCDKVVVDDYESALNAMQHLIDSQCSSIALFSSIDNLSVGKLRTKGYFDALEKNNISIDPQIIIRTDNEHEFNIQATALFDTQKVDGIFALDEHASVSAMKMSLKAGYKIPDEVSVIGFADGVWSRRLTPSLSTVSQHGPEIGEAAAQLLIARLESKLENYHYKTEIIKTELRQRESTKKIG
ncbi:LacI family transcriptional regulator [Flavobacterium branchiophilum NBRC 15030 = ATCC 35035]|uniref:LacI family transcriptional regulator n=2 Tax=Flavobacterium branchiophilum TaxID=55197 RepID=A0A2H3KBM9_9FLAO|nr:LacI family DNA-binding transcriptional regulator [Flavobacterium branchiophilum]OXA82239.1 LacI family transcriptional regulator [Flavobacterium branchiophilum NBRC 15030 = ATCC 35035]PDS24476.1 LacI family transcriptional regulator [Flavobacterium branchiophilum]TQM40800.1 LacI family transcriptional regulator [Flavobacterium branchiophilum]CCB68449.1 Probable transcriptional regulator, lacI family [Flavobacterium branchiophilum FL-15]GEM55872.1 LacI family transcriptional regulator [Flav